MSDDKRSMETPGEWLSAQGLSPEYQLTPLAGGDINATSLLTTACGRQFCIKQNSRAPADFFQAEAAGLEAIARAETLRVPEVLGVAEQFILLEYIPAGRKNDRYWQKLGSGLARMHLQRKEQFGFHTDNYCGLTPQHNRFTTNGYAFFRDQRIHFQAQLAFDRGLLKRAELKQIEDFATRLSEFIPEQAPALLHGDLWAGNIHSDVNGDPVIIDPAAYQGWPEADIAMTLLFGGFSEEFYEAYNESNPLSAGWRDRARIYNVYHLLNHLNLFGGGYHSQVMAAVRRYAG